MDKKMLKKIKEILEEANDSKIKVITQSADKVRHSITFLHFEKLKFALASQLNEPQYLSVLTNALALAIGFMSCVGSKLNNKEELTKENIKLFKGLYDECLEYIESVENHECELCADNEDDE